MAQSTDFILNLASIPEGEFEREFRCGIELFQNMENDAVSEADLQIRLDGEHRNDVYKCLFSIKGYISIPCDRCLDPMKFDLDVDYELAIRYADEYDDSRDALLVLPWSQRQFDIAPVIYDTVLLSIPLRHVHPEGECNQEMIGKITLHSIDAPAESEQEITKDPQDLDI